MQYVPRVHGNGFIQLDMTPTRRLHIWGHPDIPRQTVSTQLHDHTFGFRSRILMGNLEDVRLEAIPDPKGAYMTHRAVIRDKEDTVLQPTGERVTMEITSVNVYTAGDYYVMPSLAIHESKPRGLAVSIIEKTGPSLAQSGPSPRVFVHHGESPDNNFNRYAFPVEELWRIISDVLLKVRINGK